MKLKMTLELPGVLSRTHPNFLAKLFHQEVPEIYEGVITVKSVSRDLVLEQR